MALSTPYKSGSVSSVNGTTLVASDISFESTDVGRLIILTDGDGKLQHRKIVTFTSATEVEVDHAWNTTAWLDTVQDVEPSAGDAFVVSYLQSDSAFTGEPQVTDSGEQVRIYAVELTGGAYVHFTNKQVDLHSSKVEIGLGAGMIFGWYKYIEGEDAQVTDSCHIIDDSPSNAGNQMARGGNVGKDFGMLDIYGGTILVDKGAVFWRLYCDGKADQMQVRIINVQCFGSYGLGSRVDGNRSIFIATIVGADNNTGACNARTAVSRVSITAIDSNQAGYVWLSTNNGGPSGRLIFPRLNELDRVIRSANSEHSGNNVMEVIAKKSEVDQIPVFIVGENNVTQHTTHTFRYGNLLKPNYVDDSNSVITDTIKTAVIDATDTTVDTEDVSTGTRSELFIRHSDIVTRNGNMVLENGDGTLPSYVTKYAPYQLNSFLFGKQINSAIVTAEDFYGATQTLLDDLVLTETDKSIIDAYTEIDTPQKFYDRASAYLYDNYAGQGETLVSRDGNTIDAGSYNVVVDASAGSAFAISGNTLTIKATSFVGNIATSGTTQLDNGAEVIGTFGSTTVLPWEVKNVEGTSRIQLVNVTQSNTEVVNTKLTSSDPYIDASGTYTSSEIAEGDVVRLRVTCVVGAEALLPVLQTGVATSSGLVFQVEQKPDTVYNSNGINGSTVEKRDNNPGGTLTADYTNPMGVDVSDADGTASVKEIYAFFTYATTTEDGVENWFGGMRAIDNANYEVITANADIKIQNIGSNAVVVSDGRMYRDDGASVLHAEDGDKPIIMDSGALVTSIQPQVEAGLNANAKILSINNNSKLIPSLL
jgi:hypothetical protein